MFRRIIRKGHAATPFSCSWINCATLPGCAPRRDRGVLAAARTLVWCFFFLQGERKGYPKVLCVEHFSACLWSTYGICWTCIWVLLLLASRDHVPQNRSVCQVQGSILCDSSRVLLVCPRPIAPAPPLRHETTSGAKGPLFGKRSSDGC